MQRSKISISDIVNKIQDAGYRAKMDDRGEGHYLIETSDNGLSFFIRTYPVANEPQYVGSVMFSAAFTADETEMDKFEVMNRWNSDKRFVLAYVDEDGDYVLQGDTPVIFGCTAEHIMDFFSVFARAVPTFREYLKETGLWT